MDASLKICYKLDWNKIKVLISKKYIWKPSKYKSNLAITLRRVSNIPNPLLCLL